MRKVLLILTFIFSAVYASAQCTPDPQYTDPGIYPDTATGLAPAYINQSYSQDITVITPNDTVVDILGQTIPVTIDSISLTSVSGLPPNFYYACNPPSCGFPGGSIKCAELYSLIDPSSADIGIYPIVFETTAYASNVPFVGTYSQDDIIDYYYIEISAMTSTINKFDNTSFELKGFYPNPVINQASIQFISGLSEDVTFTIFNLLGKEIESRVLFSSIGLNTLNLDFSLYSDGIYVYTLSNGVKLLTDRIVVKN